MASSETNPAESTSSESTSSESTSPPSAPGPLSEAELLELAALSEHLVNDIPFCPWQPNTGPQTYFLLDFGRESLYGGAAGGGKSIALLMAASQFLHIPGYAALLLRKSFSDLGKPKALMDIAAQWWGGQPGCKFHAQQNTWEFDCPGGGTSKVVFGALDNEPDRYKYQGGAYHFIGFDELTQQKERDYRYLFSRVRRDTEGILASVPTRVRSTTNPGGVGHDWVHRRFIRPWEAWKEGRARRPKRNFHPAVLSDNPKLDHDDYVESMAELDAVTRAQLLRGDWNIRPDGRMFKRAWFKPCDYGDVPRNCNWVRFWDTASTEKKPGNEPDYTAGALVGRSTRGVYYILDMRRFRYEPAEMELMMKATAYYDTRRVSIAMEQEGGSQGKIAIRHFRSYVFDGFTLKGVPAVSKGSKTVAAGPVSSHASGGNVYMVRGPWNDLFLDEVEVFPDGTHDDQMDATSGAFSWLAKAFHLGLNLGTTNDAFATEDSGWRPDITPMFAYGDIAGDDMLFGDPGKGREQGGKMVDGEADIRDDKKLREMVAAAWEV